MSERQKSILYRKIGDRVRLCRETGPRRFMSQSELAERVGLQRTSVSNIEAGRQKPMLHTLVDIAKVLRVNVKVLLP